MDKRCARRWQGTVLGGGILFRTAAGDLPSAIISRAATSVRHSSMAHLSSLLCFLLPSRTLRPARRLPWRCCICHHNAYLALYLLLVAAPLLAPSCTGCSASALYLRLLHDSFILHRFLPSLPVCLPRLLLALFAYWHVGRRRGGGAWRRTNS